VWGDHVQVLWEAQETALERKQSSQEKSREFILNPESLQTILSF
jgi:hypothetical protein